MDSRYRGGSSGNSQQFGSFSNSFHPFTALAMKFGPGWLFQPFFATLGLTLSRPSFTMPGINAFGLYALTRPQIGKGDS